MENKKRNYKRRVERGQGRVEVIKHLDEISKLIEEGYTYTKIFKKMTEEGKLTLAYVSFCRTLRQKITVIKNK